MSQKQIAHKFLFLNFVTAHTGAATIVLNL